jgi:hypothetical protein
MSESPFKLANTLAFSTQEITLRFLFCDRPGKSPVDLAELKRLRQQFDDLREGAGDLARQHRALTKELTRAFRDLVVSCQELIDWSLDRAQRLAPLSDAALDNANTDFSDIERHKTITELNALLNPTANDYHTIHKAAICKALGTLFDLEQQLARGHQDAAPEGPDAGGLAAQKGNPSESAQTLPEYVTLTQIAAIVNKAKKTLENYKKAKKDPLPDPDIEGGGGKQAEWLWATIRPWLERRFKRPLPEHFPPNVNLRRAT